jgi:hypothetical protein
MSRSASRASKTAQPAKEQSIEIHRVLTTRRYSAFCSAAIVREPSFTAFPVLPAWVVAGGLIPSLLLPNQPGR